MVISALPQDVVDRIAAGEVIERPAAVVKELLENAIDAGAARIDVTIEGGGLQLLRVADDGTGIPADDLPLAFGSHATSKLSDVDDLFHIASFGFRGEALSSIAAVSRCRLLSATEAGGSGWRLDCVAGELGPLTPAACPRGTVAEVRELFFNTPARRAFLGATSSEAARCREVCSTLSLVHPGVAWRVTVDGRQRFVSEGPAELSRRVEAVYGKEFVSQLVPLRATEEGLAVEGLLSLPAAARPRPRAQQLFVNGRLIRDRSLMAAVRVACKDFLPASLQPAWVLVLTVDPLRLDVNVHPTKAEVRFRDKERVFRLVRRACREALLAQDLAPRVSADALGRLPPAQGPLGPAALPRRGPAGRTAAAPPAAAAKAVGPDDAAVAQPGLPRGQAAATDPATALEPGHAVAETPPGEGAGPSALLADVRAAARFLQVLDSYIVHDSPQGLVLIDQHALHERILYAELQRQLAAGQLTRQRLLLPETVRLSPAEHAACLQLLGELGRMGLELAPFGPDTVAISAVPSVLRSERLDDLLRALIDPPELHGGLPHGLDRRLFTMACHAAVKAGDPLGEGEIAALLERGSQLEHDASCPHGRPTRLLIDRGELERLFKRSGF